MTFAEHVLKMFRTMRIDKPLPEGVSAMNPYADKEVMALCATFCNRFFNDSRPRSILVGINPGRFGAGITGISFTDPIRLVNPCGIQNTFAPRGELSSEFIYKVIDAYGGVGRFYNDFYITAVSPLGFVQNGKNLNYYDIRALQETVKPFAVKCMKQLLRAPVNRKRCYCVGEGANLKFLTSLNNEYGWFEEIVPLAHPRFVMQYRRKQLNAYVDDYVRKLNGSMDVNQ